MNVRRIFIPVVAGFLISPALMAADINTPSDTRTFSDEYLSTAAATDVVLGGTLAVTLGAEYAVADIVTLSFSGSALDNATLASSVTVAGTATASGITFGLLSSTTDQALYRVTEIDTTAGGNTTVGVTVTFAGADVIEFDATAAAAAGVIVGFSAATDSGLALDTAGGDDRSIDYIATGTQFSAEVSQPFDAVIDVESLRTEFEFGGLNDQLIYPLSTAGGFFAAAGFDGSTITVTGDFSFLIDTDETTPGIQPLPGAIFTNCDNGDLEVTSGSATYTSPCSGGIGLFINLNANRDIDGNLQTLTATSFTVTMVVDFNGFSGTTGDTATLSSADAGEWTLNGYQALIPYMPYGSGIGQVIYLANRGTQSGDITVDWVGLNGTSGTLGVIANLGAGTTLSIGPLIKAALPTAQQTNGRLALTVTANVPSGDVQMNSQYNASGNRAFTLHEDNR